MTSYEFPSGASAAGKNHRSRRCPKLAAPASSIITLGIVIGLNLIPITAHGAAEFESNETSAMPKIMVTPQQRTAVGIVVAPLAEAPLAPVFRAPGEVKANPYTSSVVSSHITATVISRSVKLGDKITEGQKLVTLYSREMAEAQSAYVLATRDLARLESLSKYAAARELDEAMSKKQEALGRLLSYGLSQAQIQELVARGLENMVSGQFDLLASQAGTITKDNFVKGEVVEGGKTLFEIADQSNMWVEAYVSPALVKKIADKGTVLLGGNETREAQVTQVEETVDETTRTVGVHLQVDNSDRAMKAGQFVDVELFGAAQKVTPVPTAAILKDSDGGWIVYSENEDGSFTPNHVKILFTSGDQSAISGLPLGARIATAGAFFIRSEADKASFGEE